MDHRKHPHLTFIDAGIVTELTPKDRRNFIDLFYAIATGASWGWLVFWTDQAMD